MCERTQIYHRNTQNVYLCLCCKLWVVVVLMAFSSLISGIVTLIRILCGCGISNSDLADDNACLTL